MSVEYDILDLERKVKEQKKKLEYHEKRIKDLEKIVGKKEKKSKWEGW
ncbi:MAG: hypothetical protein KAV40_01300 [Thermoplasmatales archaeon]|nr:hypothetical protein [Thermoplasmatales archaeon]